MAPMSRCAMGSRLRGKDVGKWGDFSDVSIYSQPLRADRLHSTRRPHAKRPLRGVFLHCLAAYFLAAGAAAPPGLRKYLKKSEFESSTITSPWLLKVAR